MAVKPYSPANRPSPLGVLELEVAAPRLLDLGRLEQGLEVADNESPRPLPPHELEEERRSILHRAGEDLEEVALFVPIGLDAELLERLHRYTAVADTVGELLVVRVRHAQELDAALAQRADRP